MWDDEAGLIAAAADGDERAFRELVDRHYDPCLRYAMRMLGDRADAEDAVQDAFVRVYRSLDRYGERGRFRGWLFRILVNRCRSQARRAARLRLVRANAAALAASERSVEQPDVAAPATREAVQRALAMLPDALREAFLLKYIEDWTYEEMSEITGASVSALKMRVTRARDTMRGQLREMADD